MRAKVRLLLCASALAAAGASVFAWGPSGAQGSYVPPPSVQEVTIQGAVDLAEDSLRSLAAPLCTFGAPQVLATVAVTPQNVPASAMVDRTEVRIVNLSTVQEAWCRVGAAPSSTNAVVLSASACTANPIGKSNTEILY